MNLPMKSTAPTEQQLAFRRSLEASIADHGKTLDAIELLAVLSHLVGQVIALQDQRAWTPETVMELVSSNIEQGNQEVISRLLSETGGTA